MSLIEKIQNLARTAAGYAGRALMGETVQLPRARATIQHHRKGELLSEEVVHNVITKSGRDFLHLQGYGTSGLGTNGLNYIGLSNDTLTEDEDSTTLSSEIAANGLSRAQGTVSHTASTNTTQIQKVFTCTTSAQAAQKAALFDAASSGTMNHALAFTQRSLQVDDTLTITFTITLG